jgi:hypothetical protein
MKNHPKFLICLNNAAAPGKVFLVHTQSPTFLAQIHKFSNIEEIDDFRKNVGHLNHYCLPDFLLGIEVELFFSEFSALPKKFDITLKKALNWYIHVQGGK